MMIRPCLVTCLALLVGCAARHRPEQERRTVVSLHCGFNLPIYLAVGDTVRLHAARTDVSYDVLTCVDSAVPGRDWRSSASRVISVDAQGLARALRPGRADLSTLTEFGPARGQCIVLPAFAQFGFAQDSIVAPIGVLTKLSVDPRDSTGRALDAWVEFDWLGGRSQGLGTIIGSGPLVGLRPSRVGRAFLVARLGVHSDTVLVIALPQ